MTYSVYGRGCSVLSNIIDFLRAARSTCMLFCPAFFTWGFLVGPPLLYHLHCYFADRTTTCGPSRTLSPYSIISSFLCTLSHPWAYSGTGYGFSFRLTPFLLREKRFAVKVVRTACFYEIPQLIFSLYPSCCSEGGTPVGCSRTFNVG